MQPESFTADELRSETNSEIVRAVAERLGWDKFLATIGAKSIDKWTDESTGLAYELLEAAHKFADDQGLWLKMQSPLLKDETQPAYLEPVAPGLKSAQSARRWQIASDDGTWLTVEQANQSAELQFNEEA